MLNYLGWYGFFAGDLWRKTTLEKAKTLMSLLPKLYSEFLEWEKEHPLSEVRDISDFEEEDSFINYCCVSVSPLSAILARVISEREGIRLVADRDYEDDRTYVYFPARPPWEYNEREASLTKPELDAIMRKYIRVLTDESVEIG